MAVTLPKITLPPTPKNATTADEAKRNLTNWTREVEQTVRTFEKAINDLIDEINTQEEKISTVASDLTRVASSGGAVTEVTRTTEVVLTGPPGPPGAPGRDGHDGVDGRDGVDGTSGTGITGLTAGRVPFAVSSTGLQDSASFTFDSANKILTVTGSYGAVSPAIGTIPMFLKGFAGQTANLLEFRNSDNSVSARFTSNGGFMPVTGAASNVYAPIRMSNGALMTSPLSGSIEFLNDRFYLTHGIARFIPGGSVYTSTARVNSATSFNATLASFSCNNLFARDGDSIDLEVVGTTAPGAVNAKSLQVYYAGNLLYDSGDIKSAAGSGWKMRISIIRVSSGAGKVVITLWVNAFVNKDAFVDIPSGFNLGGLLTVQTAPTVVAAEVTGEFARAWHTPAF